MKLIADRMNGDILEIFPVKPYLTQGSAKMIKGGKDAMCGARPELESYIFDPEQYDMIAIGSPVWASRWAPPVNTFLHENLQTLKEFGTENISILLCQAGSGADKVIARYRKLLKAESFAAELVLYDPLTNNVKKEENEAAINEFCEMISR